jgi:LysR family cys regulon transcriptional activator
MKLIQLRHVVEVVRHGNHISKTAEALHISQPAITKHIQLLEEELGFAIFDRKRNRIVGLTEAGGEAVAIAERILGDIDNLKRLGAETADRDQGTLTIATTHTQARYVLPKVIERFVARHPAVRLRLRQGDPTRICEMVEAGEADLAIGSATTRQFPGLVRFDSHTLPRSIIAKAGHPLARVRKPTLAQLAQYPLITYDPAYSGRWTLLDTFHKAGLQPNIVFGAVDADVSKTYVELGLGIAVLATAAYDKSKDRGLVAIGASHLFEPATVYVTLRAKAYLRRATYDFIQTFDPRLKRDVIKARL